MDASSISVSGVRVLCCRELLFESFFMISKYGCFGKYILFQKIGEGLHSEKEKLYMHFHVMNHLFDDLPELEDVNRYRVLPLDKLVSIEKRLDKSLKTRAYLPIFSLRKKPPFQAAKTAQYSVSRDNNNFFFSKRHILS